MVSEARVIDGELHTIVLHPHPIWTHSGRHYPCKLLVEDFLSAFAPEPEGEAIRETEISDVMARVSGITAEISAPPAPMQLLERQKDSKTAPQDHPTPPAQAPDSAGAAKDLSDHKTLTHETGADTRIPSVLLPSQDIVAAQDSIEQRIAAFEAQKNWITDKTDALRSEMKLVATYQTRRSIQRLRASPRKPPMPKDC